MGLVLPGERRQLCRSFRTAFSYLGPCMLGRQSEALNTRDSGHTLKQDKVRLNIKVNFFPQRDSPEWSRLPRQAVQMPSLRVSKTTLEKTLSHIV